MQTLSKHLELYAPHPNQAKIHLHPARFKIGVCGRRFGKTTLAVNELREQAWRNPGTVNWYVGPTYKQAKMIAWKMLLKYIPEEYLHSKNEVDLSVILNNYSQICLKGADNEDSLRGVGLNYAVLDEFSQMKPNVWEEIIRPMLIDTGGSALFIGTPKGKNHFYKMYLREKEDNDYKSFHFTSYDNPLIEKAEIDKARKESSETYFKQEYLASFEDYVGLVYPEWNEKFHVISSNTEIPIDWDRFRFWDMATNGIVCAMGMAVDMCGNIIFYEEYYEQNRLVSDHCKAVEKIYEGQTIGMDFSCRYAFAKTQSITGIDATGRVTGKPTMLSDEYRSNGINLFHAVDSKDEGVARVQEMLRVNKEILHPFKKKFLGVPLMGAPKLFITENCKHAIEQMDSFRRISKETDTGIKVDYVDKDQHAGQCIRFGAMSRPSPSEKDEKVEYNEWGEAPTEVRIEQAANAASRERQLAKEYY